MTTSFFNIGTSQFGGQRILTITGELDLAVTARFEQALRSALATTRSGNKLVVDLSDAPFFDASALRALLRAAQTAHASGASIELITSPAVDLVLDLAELDTTLTPTRHPADGSDSSDHARRRTARSYSHNR